MNIFLVGLGLSESMKVEATKALRSAMDVYPTLDLDTLSIWDNGNAYAGTLHTNPVVASPREYIAKSVECLTLFTGTPNQHRRKYSSSPCDGPCGQLERVTEETGWSVCCG